MMATPYAKPFHTCYVQHCVVASRGSMAQGTAAAERRLDERPSNGELSCMGTGMDVACSYDDNGEPKQKQSPSDALQAAAGRPHAFPPTMALAEPQLHASVSLQEKYRSFSLNDVSQCLVRQ